MLSRAAERVYWAGRYLERAEGTARIAQQYSQLFLDLPPDVGAEWYDLVTIFGAMQAFADSGRGRTENDILQFLLAEEAGPSSLMYSLRALRENVRNSRDLLPHESWENVNELYHVSREQLALAAAGENRFEILSDCIGRCQQVYGILAATMSHHSPYRFLVLGQNIERADMTSRIIDVAAAYLREDERQVLRYESTLWSNVLRSVSGFQMYRQYCQPQVNGVGVVRFLLGDSAFPRAVQCCLDAARDSAAALPAGEDVIAALAAANELVTGLDVEAMTAAEASALMDRLQAALGRAHEAVVARWFLPGDAA